MKVILKENIKSLGKAGDIVEASNGYARNFLIPKGKAVPVNSGSMNDRKLMQENQEKIAAENLANAEIPAGSNILLEDLSNLLANEMFHSHGGGLQAVRTGVEHIASFARHLTIVTNEIFSDGERYEGDTLRYQEQLAELNRELAEKADLVVEVVCGLPNVLKGYLP